MSTLDFDERHSGVASSTMAFRADNTSPPEEVRAASVEATLNGHRQSSTQSTFAPEADHGYSNLEAVYDPDGEGIEVDGEGKQFHAQGDKEVNWYGKEAYVLSSKPVTREQNTICGLSRKLLFLALAVLLLVTLALGLGFGLGFQKYAEDVFSSEKFVAHTVLTAPRQKQKSPLSSSSNTTLPLPDTSLLIGGAIDPSYYSSKGVFNGTGIGYIGKNGDNLFIIFFQHWTGNIRWISLNTEGEYVGGTSKQTVVTDAKNSTTISVVAFLKNGTWNSHIFYVGNDGYLKERFYVGNITDRSSWQNGPLTGLKLQPFDHETVALQTCWYDNLGTDDDRGIIGSADTNSTDLDVGMHLWYASDNKTIEQYGYAYGTAQWTYQQSWFGMNVYAGVGCYSWGPGTVSYAMFVNTHNTMEIWWKDVNTSLTSTDRHPINVWSNASDAAVPGLYPTTPLGYTMFLYAQSDNGYLKGYNVSFDAEDSTIPNDITISDTAGPITALKGTHLAVTAVVNSSDEANLYAFTQIEGDDISVFTRDLFSGQWSSGTLPIPND